MPQWLYPGVFLEEMPAGVHPIPGLSTSPVRALNNRAVIGARVGSMPAQTYLQWLAQRLQSSTAYASGKPSVPTLWVNVTGTLTQLLSIEWRSGQLQGQRQSDAFFVRCDRATMTQADIDSGRVVAQAGVALTKPAEFAILRVVIGA